MGRKTIKNTNGVYKVEKGIPLERKRAIHTRFPFDKMQVGDSFYIPKSDQSPLSAMGSVYSAVNSFNRFHKKKLRVACRKDGNGLRVFRVADRK